MSKTEINEKFFPVITTKTLHYNMLSFSNTVLLFLVLIQLPQIANGACIIPPTITLAKYNSIQSSTTVAQMQQLLGGLGVPQIIQYFDARAATSNEVSYYYRGSSLVATPGGAFGSVNDYAIFTFDLSTQKLKSKFQYGLC